MTWEDYVRKSYKAHCSSALLQDMSAIREMPSPALPTVAVVLCMEALRDEKANAHISVWEAQGSSLKENDVDVYSRGVRATINHSIA